jgi:predicted P-loop ATPase
MLVLESGQGLSKSTALRALCPKDEWFSDDLPLHVDAKGVMERTEGKWIIEASDLAGKKKADIEHLKALMSRQIDGPARLSYDRRPSERARQFILVGTTNSKDYLTDPTGSRRFWPVTCGRFDLAALARDKDQLWAEANAREQQEVSIRLPEHLWAAAGEEQNKRRQRDPWEDDIVSYVSNMTPRSDGRKFVPSSLIWEALGIEKARRDRVSLNRFGEIMTRLGFENTTQRWEGEPVSGYISARTQLDLERKPK